MIRTLRVADRAPVAALLGAAFAGTEEAGIVAALRLAGDMVLELVAAPEEAPLGYIAFSRMAAPAGTLGLAPLAVHPACQRQGIGAALVREGLDRASARGWNGVFVLGEPAYYARFGFSLAAAAPFGSRWPASHLMALDLGGLEGKGGPLRYAPALEGG
ncbi:N-acetyltransferase [Paralimibaculum aggregatum]|uniref:N-acetyltransferase n=1 Tax=Paralimibaculum aggregatum TaxID=3036245 RepID=A0ABQ6LJQ6_9RHOB|nr:N-acetyltransferase [Limibaculum sp. NKW23]GMG83491.1 N-acetyltransferase [Limibaculum sp. NKW23]